MKTTVYRPYQNDYPKVLDWLLENVGNKPVVKYGDYWAAKGWTAWHTNVGNPLYMALRVDFDRSEDASLFAVRWL